MVHRRQGYRFENDWPKEELEDDLKIIDVGITLPVDMEIKADQVVLNLESAKEHFVKARKISVMNCSCRTKRRNCDAPLNTCIDINEIAERNIANGTSREINLAEALQILDMSHRAGLVHMAYVRKDIPPKLGDINSICSCCSCCCDVLSAVLRFGLAPHLLKSYSTSVTDESKCIDCGVCADRCQFGAKEMVEGSLKFKPELCFGCGLCVSTCPTNAISLMPK